ncbi:glycosyltransferase [Planctomycetota bacterium]
MEWFCYIALLAIIIQLTTVLLVYRNYRFNLNKYQRERSGYRPTTALCVPCKGLDSDFQKNITSFFNQEYENHVLYFVVEDEKDPAYEQLCKLKARLCSSSKALDIKILTVGLNASGSCSQKNYNLLGFYENVQADFEVLAFADSDICIRNDWLSHLVYPLRQQKNGVASGYRWFVPKHNKPAELALSCLNAKVAQLLGNTRFNQVWGGSMAIRTEVFKELKIDELWSKSISDDLSLSFAVKKVGLKVAFVPACLGASYESTNWQKLFEFARRQFIITRVSAPKTWLIALFGTLFSILAPLATAAIAVQAVMLGHKYSTFLIVVPFLLLAGQLMQALLRQSMIAKLLAEDHGKTKAARYADILFFWPLSFIMLFFILSSAFGRTIRWRGIRYQLLGPTKTIILEN